jgi:hypothetical protein
MQILARYLQKLPGQPRAIWETCLYGLAAGAATVVFQLGINWLYRLGLVQLSHQSMTTFLIGSFAVIVTSSLLVGSQGAPVSTLPGHQSGKAGGYPDTERGGSRLGRKAASQAGAGQNLPARSDDSATRSAAHRIYYPLGGAGGCRRSKRAGAGDFARL